MQCMVHREFKCFMQNLLGQLVYFQDGCEEALQYFDDAIDFDLGNRKHKLSIRATHSFS